MGGELYMNDYVLTKLHKQILRALSPYIENPLYHCSDLTDILDNKYSYNEVSDALFELADLGMVEFDDLANGICFIRPTYKGLHYKEYIYRINRKIRIERIWIFLAGVASTVIATLIIHFLAG